MKNTRSIQIQCELLDVLVRLEEAKAYDAPWLEKAKKVYRDARGRFVSKDDSSIGSAIDSAVEDASQAWEGLNNVGKEVISRSLEEAQKGVENILEGADLSQQDKERVRAGSDRFEPKGMRNILQKMESMDNSEPSLEEVGEGAAASGTFFGLATKALGVGAGVAGLSLLAGAKGSKAEIAKGVIGLAAGDLSAEGASYLLNETEGTKDMPAWQKQAIAGVAGVAGGLAAHKGLSKMGKTPNKIPSQQNEAMGGQLNNVLKKAGIVGAGGAAIKSVQDAIAQVQKQASDLLNIRKAQDDIGEAASKAVKTDGPTKVDTYVVTRAASEDYNWRKYGGKVSDISETPDMQDINRLKRSLIQGSSPSVVLSKEGNKLILIVTGQRTKYKDIGGRTIRTSAAWHIKNPSEKEYAQIKKLASNAIRGKLDVTDSAARYNSKGQRFGQEDTIIADWEVSDNAILDNKAGTPELKVKGKPNPRKGRAAKDSPERREELAQEIESVDLSDDLTAIVTKNKSKGSLKGKADRAISALIDSENWSDL